MELKSRDARRQMDFLMKRLFGLSRLLTSPTWDDDYDDEIEAKLYFSFSRSYLGSFNVIIDIFTYVPRGTHSDRYLNQCVDNWPLGKSFNTLYTPSLCAI